MDYQHFLLTKFNVPIENTMKTKVLEEIDIEKDVNYLTERFNIFMKYTVPSVKAQTDNDFIWLILFSCETPERFKNLMGNLHDCNNNFIPLYIDRNETAGDAIEKYMNGFDAEYYLTTRLDNDDAIAADFMKTIHENIGFCEHAQIIILENGFQYDESRRILSKYNFKFNHFSTLIARKEEHNKSIFSYNHMNIKTYFDVVSINNENPMWLEVVHSSNISNRMHLKYSDIVFSAEMEGSFGIVGMDLEHRRIVLLMMCLLNIPLNIVRLYKQYGMRKIILKIMGGGKRR